MNYLLKTVVIMTSFVGVAFTGSTFADSGSVNIPTTPTVTIDAPLSENMPATTVVSKNIITIKAKGAILIAQRVASLNKLSLRVISAKQLTDEQKGTLTGMISTNVTGLNDLATTLSGETDITKAKEDINAIFTNFRIYAVFIPKINSLIGIYSLQNHVNTLISTTIPGLQTKIDIWKAKAIDTTTYQKSLDAATVTVGSFQTKFGDLLTKTNALQPSDYPATSKTTFASIKSDMKSMSAQLKTLRSTLVWKNPKAPKVPKTPKASNAPVQ